MTADELLDKMPSKELSERLALGRIRSREHNQAAARQRVLNG